MPLEQTLFDSALRGVEQFLREARSLASLRHPHVVQFLGVCIEPGRYTLVTEFMPRGNVWQLLHKVGMHRHREALQWGVRGFVC